MSRWLIVIALAGCGRGRFDSVPGDGDHDVADGTPDASSWTLVQTRGAEGSAVTVDRFGSQHLIVVAVQLAGSALVTAVTDSSNCNAYTAIPDTHTSCGNVESEIQILYAKNSCVGANAISVAGTGTVIATAAWEVAGIRTDDPLDTATALIQPSPTSSPLGPVITTSNDNEFIVSIAIMNHMATQIHSGSEFTNDHLLHNNGWAHLSDPMARAGSYQAQWDQPDPGSYCASAAAFKSHP
jgi:hypothetical protein